MADEQVFMNLVEKFNHLSIEKDNFQDVVTDFKILVVNDRAKLLVAASRVNFNSLLEFTSSFCNSSENSCSKTSPRNNAMLKDISVIMEKVFNCMENEKVFEIFVRNNISNVLLRIGNEDIQIVCLQQLHRVSLEKPELLMKNESFTQILIKYTVEEFLSVASVAKKSLDNLFSTSNNLDWFFTQENMNVCKTIANELNTKQNSAQKFRFFELFTDLVLAQPSYLELCNSPHLQIFDSLFTELTRFGDTDILTFYIDTDILSQLNALEIIAKLAKFQEGLCFIQEKGVLKWIEMVITSDDVMMTFLLPGAVKFFGTIAVLKPSEVISSHSKIMNTIFQLLHSDDPSLKSLCAETIAVICSTTDGLKLLYTNPDTLKSASRTMGEMVLSFAVGEHGRRRTLDSLVLMFDHDSDNDEASMICEKLYRYLASHPMKFLFNLLKQPYSELRYGTFNLLKVLAKYSWVEQDVALCAGFVEYLLNRNTEHEKEGKEMKYEIIKRLSISASAKDNLGVAFYDMICKYAKEGALYAEAQVVVETEEAN